MNNLNEIADLKDNWNCNGAKAFPESIFRYMSDLMDTIDPKNRPTRFFPTASDSIQFEYEKSNGEYLEFELDITGALKVFRWFARVNNCNNCYERYISYKEADKLISDFKSLDE